MCVCVDREERLGGGGEREEEMIPNLDDDYISIPILGLLFISFI